MKQHHKQHFKETGNKIQIARLKKGFSLQDMGKKSNISAARLSKIENGETDFMFTTFVRIARALDVELYTLVGDG